MPESITGVNSSSRTFDNANVQTTAKTADRTTDNFFKNTATDNNLQGVQERTLYSQANVTRANLAATVSPLDASSERNLARVNPQLAARIRNMAADLKAQGITIAVTSGLRTFAEQDALYAQGRTKPGGIVTKAKGGQSLHNYGLATDVVPLGANGKPNWGVSESTWQKIGAAGKKQGLEWGGDWKSFKDRPHFQMTAGKSISTLLSEYKTNNGNLGKIWEGVNKSYPNVGGTTPTVPAPPTSPSSDLRVGSRGPAVAQLQRDLNSLGYRLSADGVFGQKTDAAVRKFQGDHRLTADGIVGPKTRAAIEAAKRPAPPPAPPKPTAPVPTATLKKGSRGEQVKQLQNALVKLGFMSQAQMNTGPGIFGPKTEAALRNFQKSKGLVADGIYGAKSRAALSNALNGASAPKPAAPALPVPTATLRKGSKGEQVKQLQNALVKLGFMTQAQMNTGPGIFGSRTETALRNFQRSKGLVADGVYGPKSRAALSSALGGAPVNPPRTPNPPTNPNPGGGGRITPDNLARVPGSENRSREFKQKVIDIAGRLQMNPNHLMSIMSFESGLNPRAVNKYSNATGLIQFLPSTARGLGTSVDALRGMSAERQLDFVEKYLQPYKGRMNTVEDAYMAVFYPAAIGKSNSSTLFSRGTTAYSQNSGLDLNRDGSITKGEAATRVRQIYENATR